MNTTIKKIVDNVFKRHKPFFINIRVFRVMPIQAFPLFADFRPLKLQSRDWALLKLVHIKLSYAMHVFFPNFVF